MRRKEFLFELRDLGFVPCGRKEKKPALCVFFSFLCELQVGFLEWRFLQQFEDGRRTKWSRRVTLPVRRAMHVDFGLRMKTSCGHANPAIREPEWYLF